MLDVHWKSILGTDVFDTDMFDACEPIKQSMPPDCFKILARCVNFSDDWDDNDSGWDAMHTDAEEEPGENTVPCCQKFSVLEDARTRRWQSMVDSWKWLTADKSQVVS